MTVEFGDIPPVESEHDEGVKLGLILLCEYEIQLWQGKTTLTKEEWLKEYEARLLG